MLVTGTNVQTIRKSLKSKVDTLPDDLVVAVWTLLANQSIVDDTSYLNSIPGMAASIREGLEAPISDCVPLSEVWPDV
jgi:hypothetical protein